MARQNCSTCPPNGQNTATARQPGSVRARQTEECVTISVDDGGGDDPGDGDPGDGTGDGLSRNALIALGVVGGAIALSRRNNS